MSPTPTPSSPPRGVSAWTQRLVAVELPLLSPPAVIDALLDEDPPTARLIDALQRDLPLGLAVLLEGQKRLRHGQVASLSHAVGALGLGGIQRVVQRQAARPLNPEQPGHSDYAAAVATSRLAAHLVAQFAPNDTLEERLRKMWEMQVQMMAEWRLPLAAPDLAHQIQTRIAAGERPAQVEQALLGCQMRELNAALAAHFGLIERDDNRATQVLDALHLGQAARLAWVDANPKPVPTELGRWLYQPSTLPSVLHLLAHEAMRSWYSPRTRLLQDVLSTHRHWRIEAVMVATRRAAVAASREMLTRGVLVSPATRLLWPRWQRPKRALGRPTTAHPGTTTSATQASPHASHLPRSIDRGSPARTLIDQFVDDCTQGRHADLGAFFQAFQRVLSTGLGMERFALFLKTSQADQLVCFMARGFGPAIIPRQYVVSLVDGNLLAKVFSQPHGFLLGQSERLPSLRQRLPAALQSDLYPGGAMWGSVQVQDRSVGVVWADGGSSALRLDDTQYAGFKLVCRHFGEALTRLMRQQKQRAAPLSASK